MKSYKIQISNACVCVYVNCRQGIQYNQEFVVFWRCPAGGVKTIPQRQQYKDLCCGRKTS